MDRKQQKLYEEWNRLKSATSESRIKFSDFEELDRIEEIVWAEISHFLSPAERFALSKRLKVT